MRSTAALRGDLDAIDARLDELGADDLDDDWGVDLDWRSTREPAAPPGDGHEPVSPTRGPAVPALDWLRTVGTGLALRDRTPIRVPRRAAHPDLPAPVVADGYRVDGRGALRRCCDGAVVPGARPVTLGRAWRFDSDGFDVFVPADLAGARPELEWCTRWPADAAADRSGVAVAAHPVPLDEWVERAGVAYAWTAPELAVDALLDIDAVAELAVVSRQTISTYLARAQMPAPQVRVANSPLWSLPVVAHWLSHRPGPGARS